MAWDAGEGMGWWMLFGGLLSILFWGTVVYLIVTLIRSPRRDTQATPDDATAILKRRYANGEIDQDEYQRMRRDLAA